MADLTDLNAKVERLEERMNTARAETETAFERLRSDFAVFGKQAAERETRQADRFREELSRKTNVTPGAIAIAVAIPGFLIVLPQITP